MKMFRPHRVMIVTSMVAVIFFLVCFLAACTTIKSCEERCVESADNLLICEEICNGGPVDE
jgi:hypothetical protein